MFLKLKPCRFAAVALFPRLSQPYRRHDASLSSPSNLWPLKCTYCGDRRAICMELEGTLVRCLSKIKPVNFALVLCASLSQARGRRIRGAHQRPSTFNLPQGCPRTGSDPSGGTRRSTSPLDFGWAGARLSVVSRIRTRRCLRCCDATVDHGYTSGTGPHRCQSILPCRGCSTDIPGLRSATNGEELQTSDRTQGSTFGVKALNSGKH